MQEKMENQLYVGGMKINVVYDGILKGIYVKTHHKHLFIVGHMFFNGESLAVVMYNNSKKHPIALKIEAVAGKLGKVIPLPESIKVQNCQAFIEYK